VLKYDLSGKRFSRWTAVYHVSHGIWECKCDCGTTSKVNGKNLRYGNSKSCGCLRVDIGATKNRTHGHTANREYSPEYNAYRNMLRRCFEKTNEKYPQYGGRGISVCDRWNASFDNFFADMGKKPSPLHSLDRVDVNEGYSPGNCRWATPKEQARNKTCNVIVSLGSEQITLAEACERLGLKYGTIHNRMNRYGMTFDEALNVPSRLKLSKEQIQEIINTTPYRGVTVDLSKKFGVSNVRIGQIMRGRAAA